jgi:uncharacterized damage-inducible protein DinB
MSLVREMFEYAIWASQAIWNIVEKLTDDEFNRSLGEHGGSLHARYIHLAEDTWEWFHDWQGEEPEEPEFQDMKREDLFHFMMDYILKWRELADSATTASYVEERGDQRSVISLDEMVFHLVSHHTYHRGQIAMGLRLLGKDVQMIDYIPYRLMTA